MARTATGSAQRRPALPRAGTAGCPANPCLPPPPHPPPASRPQPGPPLGGGGGEGPKWPKWCQISRTSLFALLGPKMQKSAHFAFLRPKVRKSANFRIRTPKSVKSDAETIGFISISGQGAKMTPKCILAPEMHFGVQNALSGPKMHFGHQNAPRRKGARVAPNFCAPL